MAHLSPPSKRIKTDCEDDSKCILTCMPTEIFLEEIVIKVASQSLPALFHLKLTCKKMLNVTEDKSVYKHVTCDTITFSECPQTSGEASFLSRCEESGNLEFLYRRGMVAFFRRDSKCHLKGLHDLYKAAQQGHKKSMYVFAMLFLSGNIMNTEYSEAEMLGIVLGYLRLLRNQKCVLKCRNDVQEFASKLKWDMIYGVVEVPRKRLCADVPCMKTWRLKTGRLYFTDEDDDENDPSMCENCRWDHELKEFYTMMN